MPLETILPIAGLAGIAVLWLVLVLRGGRG
jgi:hypothetical protein